MWSSHALSVKMKSQGFMRDRKRRGSLKQSIVSWSVSIIKRPDFTRTEKISKHFTLYRPAIGFPLTKRSDASSVSTMNFDFDQFHRADIRFFDVMLHWKPIEENRRFGSQSGIRERELVGNRGNYRWSLISTLAMISSMMEMTMKIENDHGNDDENGKWPQTRILMFSRLVQVL